MSNPTSDLSPIFPISFVVVTRVLAPFLAASSEPFVISIVAVSSVAFESVAVSTVSAVPFEPAAMSCCRATIEGCGTKISGCWAVMAAAVAAAIAIVESVTSTIIAGGAVGDKDELLDILVFRGVEYALETASAAAAVSVLPMLSNFFFPFPCSGVPFTGCQSTPDPVRRPFSKIPAGVGFFFSGDFGVTGAEGSAAVLAVNLDIRGT